MHGPEGPQPTTADEIYELGDSYWPLQAYRELDDALLHLRVNEPLIGLVCIRTEGKAEDVLAIDQTVEEKNGQKVVVGKTATLELAPGQTETLALSQQVGVLSLALRSIADTSNDSKADETDSRRNINVVRFGVSTTITPR